MQVQMEMYIRELLLRLNWLASGSRAPFGTITEKRCAVSIAMKALLTTCLIYSSVLLLLECSAATLPHIAQLQSNLFLLLREQLSLVTEFNIIRYVIPIIYTPCVV